MGSGNQHLCCGGCPGQAGTSAQRCQPRPGLPPPACCLLSQNLAWPAESRELTVALTAGAPRGLQMKGYVEVHMEQGPVLQTIGEALGPVTAIAGQTRLQVCATPWIAWLGGQAGLGAWLLATTCSLPAPPAGGCCTALCSLPRKKGRKKGKHAAHAASSAAACRHCQRPG